jgi:hypothetical protein
VIYKRSKLTANITTEEIYCTYIDPVLGMKTSLKRAFSFQTLLVVRNEHFQLVFKAKTTSLKIRAQELTAS